MALWDVGFLCACVTLPKTACHIMKGLLMFVLLTNYLEMNAFSVHVNEFV